MRPFFKLTSFLSAFLLLASLGFGQQTSSADLFAMVGEPLAFNNTSIGASTYAWDFGDGTPMDHAAEPNHAYTTPGTYQIKLLVSNGTCNQVITKKVEVMAEVAEATLFPNPARDFSTLQFANDYEGSVQVSLLTMEGKRIQHFETQKTSKEFTHQFDLNGLAGGVYLVSLEFGDQAQTIKLLKQ